MAALKCHGLKAKTNFHISRWASLGLASCLPTPDVMMCGMQDVCHEGNVYCSRCGTRSLWHRTGCASLCHQQRAFDCMHVTSFFTGAQNTPARGCRCSGRAPDQACALCPPQVHRAAGPPGQRADGGISHGHPAHQPRLHARLVLLPGRHPAQERCGIQGLAIWS